MTDLSKQKLTLKTLKRSLIMLVRVSCFLSALIISQFSFSQSFFQGFDLVVSDPGAAVAAINKYQESPTGEANNSNTFLYQYLANGSRKATHLVVVVYPSANIMEETLLLNGSSPDWLQFAQEMRAVAEIENEVIGQFIATGGDPARVTSGPGRAGVIYEMTVSDPAAYLTAFNELSAANPDVKFVSYLSTLLANGENPSTHNAVNWFNSPSELLMNQPQTYDGWEAFLEKISDVRTIESTAMVQQVASWVTD